MPPPPPRSRRPPLPLPFLAMPAGPLARPTHGASPASLPAAVVAARSCPLVLPSHHSGGGGDGGGGGGGSPRPACSNTGAAYLNASTPQPIGPGVHAATYQRCPGLGCPTAGPLQRWRIQLPPWAPPGAALLGRLLTIQARPLIAGAIVATGAGCHCACAHAQSGATAKQPHHASSCSCAAVCGPRGAGLRQPAGRAPRVRRHLWPFLRRARRPSGGVAFGSTAGAALPPALAGKRCGDR